MLIKKKVAMYHATETILVGQLADHLVYAPEYKWYSLSYELCHSWHRTLHCKSTKKKDDRRVKPIESSRLSAHRNNIEANSQIEK